MFESEYSKAAKKWVAAEERLLASEERIGAIFIDMMFGPDRNRNTAPSRPCVNVTPPKQTPKK
jgi:hypothetical protein